MNIKRPLAGLCVVATLLSCTACGKDSNSMSISQASQPEYKGTMSEEQQAKLEIASSKVYYTPTEEDLAARNLIHSNIDYSSTLNTLESREKKEVHLADLYDPSVVSYVPDATKGSVYNVKDFVIPDLSAAIKDYMGEDVVPSFAYDYFKCYMTIDVLRNSNLGNLLVKDIANQYTYVGSSMSDVENAYIGANDLTNILLRTESPVYTVGGMTLLDYYCSLVTLSSQGADTDVLGTSRDKLDHFEDSITAQVLSIPAVIEKYGYSLDDLNLDTDEMYKLRYKDDLNPINAPELGTIKLLSTEIIDEDHVSVTAEVKNISSNQILSFDVIGVYTDLAGVSHPVKLGNTPYILPGYTYTLNSSESMWDFASLDNLAVSSASTLYFCCALSAVDIIPDENFSFEMRDRYIKVTNISGNSLKIAGVTVDTAVFPYTTGKYRAESEYRVLDANECFYISVPEELLTVPFTYHVVTFSDTEDWSKLEERDWYLSTVYYEDDTKLEDVRVIY